MQIRGHDIAVCSWSLQAKGMAELVAKVKTLGLEHVQLALSDLVALGEDERRREVDLLRAAGIRLTGGMVGFAGEDYSTIDAIRRTGGFIPETEWADRRRVVEAAARLAEELGVRSITSHVGFVPPADYAGYPAAVARVREVAATFAGHGVDLLMETGQEPAEELRSFLEDLNAANVHVNFDPANMILYGAGDPIEAVRVLREHIRHVHVKDATASARPGVDWGEEVPFGSGQVGASRFLAALKEIGYAGPLAIEREAGIDRMGDAAKAIELLQRG